jgi:hypothetical protein
MPCSATRSSTGTKEPTIAAKNKNADKKTITAVEIKRHASKVNTKKARDRKRIEQKLASHPFLTRTPTSGTHGAPLPSVARSKNCEDTNGNLRDQALTPTPTVSHSKDPFGPNHWQDQYISGIGCRSLLELDDGDTQALGDRIADRHVTSTLAANLIDNMQPVNSDNAYRIKKTLPHMMPGH